MTHLPKIFLISGLIVLLGASCIRTNTTPTPPQGFDQQIEWQQLQPGLERRIYRSNEAEAPYEFIAYRLNTKLFQLNLQHSQAPKRLQDWHKDSQAILSINGAYFTEDMTPTGLFIDNGKTINAEAYDTDRSGTVVIENGIPRFVNRLPLPQPGLDAFQSFPLLVKDGRPNIDTDSEKVARRTAIGFDEQGRLIIIIVDKTPLSLYRFAKILAASDVHMKHALNLDGGPSSGLIYEGLSFNESLLPLLELPIVLTLSALSPDEPNGQ